MKQELFGTAFQPNARWECGRCGRKNVSRLGVPLREKEPIVCRGCRRVAVLTIDLHTTPKVWGGAA